MKGNQGISSGDKHVHANNKNGRASSNTDVGSRTPIPAQAFEVFQDVLAAEISEENSHLRNENERLRVPFHDALSTVRVVLLGREYVVRLEDGTMSTTALIENRYTEENVESEPASSPALPHRSRGRRLFGSASPVRSLRSLGRRLRPGPNSQQQNLGMLVMGLATEEDLTNCRCFLVPIEGAESVPLLSIGHSMVDMLRRSEGGGGGGEIRVVQHQQKLDAYLGDRIRLGSLGMMSSFQGGKLIIKEDPRNSFSQRLFLFLSDLVFVTGCVTGISVEDFDGGYQELNQQLSARIFAGAPARIRGGEDATFTIETVGLKMLRGGLEETLRVSLARFEVEPSGLPQDLLRYSVASAIGGGPFYRVLEENHRLRASILKLNAVRDRLQTVDILYQSGSARVKLDQGRLKNVDDEGANMDPPKWTIDLLDSCDSSICMSFNDLHTVEITVAGIKISGRVGFVSAPPAVRFDDDGRLIIRIPLGKGIMLHGVLVDRGSLGEPSVEMLRSVLQSFNGRFMSALTGAQDVFPDEVGWLLREISFDPRIGPVRNILGKLNVSVEDQLHSEPVGEEVEAEYEGEEEEIS